MASTNDIDDSFDTAFETVIHEFRSKLKDDALYREILKTRNIEEVYNVTDRLQEEQARTGRLRHMSKINPFLEGLNGYASVIEVFMQAKPDVLALIWGPIKLILQWADVLKQSMDAIIDTTDEIGARLPEFRKATHLFGKNKLISDVLILFFRDILDFYVVVLKFFSLPRLKILFEALWPRQRDKIKIVVSNIQRHTLLLRNEVRLEHIQAEYDFRQQALQHFEKSEASHLRQEYHCLRTSISPRTYKETLAYLDDRTCREAGIWLMKHDKFRDWIDPTKKSASIIWLQGIPGSGKTHLARTVVHEAKGKGHSLFAFLSYIFSSSISTLSILHSLIFQLTADDFNLQSIVCHSSGEGFRRNLEVAQGVLKALLCSAGPVYISLDGLDEIDGSTRCRILTILLQLSTEIDTLRVMISCRPEADLTSILSEKCSTIRVNEQNGGGVQSYISQRTMSWYEERAFYPEARKEMETLLAPLATKSKGMFLYAKVVLDTIRFLELDEIMEDLRVLPETMNDAYGRVLERINNIDSPIAKAKARRIVGWIGVSPAPLTIHELEQALVFHAQGIDGTGNVTSTLSVVQLCGPIVEVVNDYVQYVHFTVYEFFLSSRISNAIDPQQSRISLAACCIKYLCQHHHNPTIDEETRSDFALGGAYRFHYFACSFWLKLLEETSLSIRGGSLPNELIDLLEIFYDTRGDNAPEIDEGEQDEKFILQSLKKRSPKLYAKIGKTVSFQDMCSKSEFELRKDRDWTSLDPLEISRTSCQVYGQIEKLLFASAKGDETTRRTLERHYGNRLYKCAYVGCTFNRHGFESNALRRSHEQSHTKPWKCSFADCEFNKGGFLSRRMRDDHLDHFHFQDPLQTYKGISGLDEEDLKSVCFDLVRADDVAGMRTVVTANKIEDQDTIRSLIECAAQSASPEMLTILEPLEKQGFGLAKYLFRGVADGNNQHLFEYILGLSGKEFMSMFQNVYHDSSSWQITKEIGLVEVMAKGNHEMLDIMCKWVEQDLSRGKLRPYLASAKMISATTGDKYRQQILLGLWRKVPRTSWNDSSWKNALMNVASTTCSVELAEFLLAQQVPVDWRRSKVSLTPLLHATKKTSAAAADLAKLLLFKGAKTMVQVGDYRVPNVEVQASKGEGAQQISKWLGVTWDELVAQAEKARQHSADLNTEAEAGRDGTQE